jgi:hypothetical protein
MVKIIHHLLILEEVDGQFTIVPYRKGAYVAPSLVISYPGNL